MKKYQSPLTENQLQEILLYDSEESCLSVKKSNPIQQYQPSSDKQPSSVETSFKELEDCRQLARSVLDSPVCITTDVELVQLPESKIGSTTNLFNGTCRRRLFKEISNEEYCSSTSAKMPRLDCTSDNSGIIKNQITSELEKLKQMKLLDQKAGRTSAARRKLKKIKILENLIVKVNRGEPVDIAKEMPLSTPPKSATQVASSASEVSDSLAENTNNHIKTTMIREVEEGTRQGTRKMTRKENYCIECKKCVKEFCKHYANVHKNTPAGIKLNELNKLADKALKKKLKTEITDVLRKKGNAALTKLIANNSLSGVEPAQVIPVKRSLTNENNLVQCSHCEGYYSRRKFSQHLKICKIFLDYQSKNSNNLQGNDALKNHSLPVVLLVDGASDMLMKEVINNMKPRKTKDVAVKDSLIMKYASEFHKTRRAPFQKNYVSRVVTDLARILLRMKEVVGDDIKCFEDILNPIYFSALVDCILKEGGYNEESGSVSKCGIANRLRSHIKGAAETAKRLASEAEAMERTSEGSKRKRIKHFLEVLKEKWANEVGRIFDEAVKMSRSEKGKKLAAEEDIVKTCEYICSQYRKVVRELDSAPSGSAVKQSAYNTLVDLLVSHIMCLIRRRPVDFKRAQNLHYDKLDQQEDLITEIKNSKFMMISEEDVQMCNRFKLFYVPGKGWKELVPIALTNLMKDAMDCIQRNKKFVGVSSDMLFIRARELPVNPRESLRKITKNLKLKKPLDMCGNGLRHHAATWSKLHSSHPQYQDYLAGALGHTLHIHKLHYEMPTSVLQKRIVCPVLHNMTKPSSTRNERNINSDGQVNNLSPLEENQNVLTLPDVPTMPDVSTILDVSTENMSDYSDTELKQSKQERIIVRCRWTDEEKDLIYSRFGEVILDKEMPPRKDVITFLENHTETFNARSVESVITFINNKILRKQKNVTPEVKKHLSKSYRRLTNVPI